jgi:hypothetical protein
VEKSWRLFGENVEKPIRVEKPWRLLSLAVEKYRPPWRKHGDN